MPSARRTKAANRRKNYRAELHERPTLILSESRKKFFSCSESETKFFFSQKKSLKRATAERKRIF